MRTKQTHSEKEGEWERRQQNDSFLVIALMLILFVASAAYVMKDTVKPLERTPDPCAEFGLKGDQSGNCWQCSPQGFCIKQEIIKGSPTWR